MKSILIVLLLFAPVLLFAQGFQINLQGQKQNAMAGAGSALILDESTVFFNPGGMSMVKFNAVSAGVSPLWFMSAFSSTTINQTEHSKNTIATPFAAYGIWGPELAKWKIGFAIYSPFGGLVDWGNSWTGKFTVTSLDLKTIYFQPTFSYKLTDNLGIGAGVIYNSSTVNLQRALPISFMDGTDAHVQLKGTGKGYGWNAGIYYSIPAIVAISIVHHSKVGTNFNNGDATFTVPDGVIGSFLAGNTFTTNLPLPSTTTLGLAFSVNDQIGIAFDANFVNWKVYKELAFDYAENTSSLQDSKSDRMYGNGGSVKIGIQHKTTDRLSIRAGTGYVLTPVKNGYVTPEAPDANRFVLSTGFGYELTNKWKLNASFLYEDILARSEKNNETELEGTFKTHVVSPGLSIGYRW